MALDIDEIKARWKTAKEGLADWRKEARECFAFRAGDQWSQEDKAKLEDEGRPAVTFDRIGAMIDSVCGLQINNRQEARYYPREMGDVQVNEVYSEAAKWVRDQCEAEDEESDAFDDAATCGVGCTETRMDYESDADGKIVIERRDPLTLFWNPVASKRNLSDTNYVFHAAWTYKDEAELRWPGKIDGATNEAIDDYKQPHDADKAFLYQQDSVDDDSRKDQVLILHYQCWELKPRYRVFDPYQNKIVVLDQEQFSRLDKNVGAMGMKMVGGRASSSSEIPYVKQYARHYYRAFVLGDTILEEGDSPCQDGFTFKFITAKRDRNKRSWYGLVRPMMDPQRWGNKWISQVMDIQASNVKGGAFIEEGALVDKVKAERDWSAPAPLITLKEGGISKVKERQPAQYPAGLDRMMTFAFDSLPLVSGIPLEAMGIVNREQAGVLEAQRKQAAMAVLAPLFNAMRRYHKEQGKLILHYIAEYLSDGRLIRIMGQNGSAKYIPIAKQSETIKYDVVVDEAPNSPDFRQKTWEALGTVLPIMLKQGMPIPAEVFKYAPLPADVATAMAAASQNAIPPQVQQQMQAMQQQIQQLGANNQSLQQTITAMQQDKALEIGKLEAKREDARLKAAVKLKTAEMSAPDPQQALLDAALKAKKTNADIATKREKVRGETMVKHEKNMLDAATKMHKTRVDAAAKRATQGPGVTGPQT